MIDDCLVPIAKRVTERVYASDFPTLNVNDVDIEKNEGIVVEEDESDIITLNTFVKPSHDIFIQSEDGKKFRKITKNAEDLYMLSYTKEAQKVKQLKKQEPSQFDTISALKAASYDPTIIRLDYNDPADELIIQISILVETAYDALELSLLGILGIFSGICVIMISFWGLTATYSDLSRSVCKIESIISTITYIGSCIGLLLALLRIRKSRKMYSRENNDEKLRLQSNIYLSAIKNIGLDSMHLYVALLLYFTCLIACLISNPTSTLIGKFYEVLPDIFDENSSQKTFWMSSYLIKGFTGLFAWVFILINYFFYTIRFKPSPKVRSVIKNLWINEKMNNPTNITHKNKVYY